MKRILAGLMVMTVASVAAMGGGLKTEQVAGDAVWVAHLDAVALLKSGIAKFVLAEAERKEGFLNGIATMRQELGFDPLRDVRGVTLYGKVHGDESGVVVFDATTDREKLLGIVAQRAPYKQSQYGDYTLHQWTDPAKTVRDKRAGEQVVRPARERFGCFHDPNTILVATSMDLLKDAIDVLDGEARSLAETEALPTLPKPAPGVFLTLAAEDIKPPAPKPGQRPRPHAAVLRNITDLSLQLGEVEEAMFLHLTALAGTPKQAMRVRQVVQGLVAVWQIMLAEREDLPVLGETVQVNGEGGTVTIDAAVPTVSLIEMIQTIAAKRAAMQQGAGRGRRW